MKEHELKDKILNHLRSVSSDTIEKLSEKFKIDYYFICYCVDDLIKDNLIDFVNITSMNFYDAHNKMISINHRGNFFLKQSGGYSKRYKVTQRQNMYVIAKTIMAYVSSVAIIYVTYLNYKATDKANDNKKITNELNILIDSLSRSNDSLSSIIKAKNFNYNNSPQDTSPNQRLNR